MWPIYLNNIHMQPEQMVKQKLRICNRKHITVNQQSKRPPTIASVSLGATRDFILRNEYDAEHKILYELGHGDVLVMAGATQKHWRHGVPKRANVVNPRINLTFRKIVQKEEKDQAEKQ
eukprot:TRINITY_DN1698_c0_g1_i1.p7 TRINITY_DN1698_c0_g1~~TRINITY_DN1698_c0_g1_i1.p7  ORF type:complete len:119 (-),score=14.45 TRINITY_DN1698_c0_g1_i1:878-1234(-)